MTEMVERVARALWPWLRRAMPDFERQEWDDLNPREIGKQAALDAARAAIEAMREPAGAMVAAGDDAEAAANVWLANPQDAGDTWRAMIDAALAEPPPDPAA